MAFAVATGSFVKDSSGTANATNTISNPLGGVPPKAIILWSANKTATGFVAGQHFALGISDGTTSRCLALASDDNAGTTQSGQRYVAKGMVLLSNGAPTLSSEAGVAWSGNDVVLTWTTNDAVAAIIHYIVLGGTDLTNAAVVENAKDTSAGTQDYTNVGFEGDCMIHICCGMTAVGDLASWFEAGFGAAVSSSARWAIAAGVEDAVTMNFTAKSAQVTTSVLTGLDALGTGYVVAADFSAWLSNGFQLNFTDPSGAARLFATLVLKGGQYAVGAFNKNADGSPPDTQDVAVAFDPVAVLQASFGIAATTTISPDSSVAFGASNGTTHKAIWSGTKDATINTQADSRTSDVALTLNTAGTPANHSESTVAMGTLKFTPTWNPNNAVAVEVGYVAFGNNAAAPTVNDHTRTMLMAA